MLSKFIYQQRPWVKVIGVLVVSELLIRLLFALSTQLLSIPLFDTFLDYQTSNDLTELSEIISAPNSAAPKSLKSLKIWPYANIFNRPVHLFEHTAGYLGPRPRVDTEADLPLLVQICRGTQYGNEKMRNVGACLKFLDEKEESYYSGPEPKQRASVQHRSSLEIGGPDVSACSGPIVTYHTYWRGGVTWRVEAFVKSYLFTQNLACSRLWMWFDADEDPRAAEKTLTDARFARFLPLVGRGDISVKAWNVPDRVAVPESKLDRSWDYVEFEIDEMGQRHLRIPRTVMPFETVAMSDLARFVILHLFGGVYLDIDMLLLRDIRPLLLPRQHNWMERWGTSTDPGDYNTAIISLEANSSLSTFFLIGGIRAAVNFHARAVGHLAVGEGQDDELFKFNDGLFDPVWTVMEGFEGECTVPCLRSTDDAFRARPLDGEWDAYRGQEVKRIHAPRHDDTEYSTVLSNAGSGSPTSVLASALAGSSPRNATSLATLLDAGVVNHYKEDKDRYSAKNRTLQNFYKGAWAYHVHNQWSKTPEPWSWLDVLQQSHNEFFSGRETNPYGEKWKGPTIMAYDLFLDQLDLVGNRS